MYFISWVGKDSETKLIEMGDLIAIIVLIHSLLHNYIYLYWSAQSVLKIGHDVTLVAITGAIYPDTLSSRQVTANHLKIALPTRRFHCPIWAVISNDFAFICEKLNKKCSTLQCLSVGADVLEGPYQNVKTICNLRN